VQHARPYYSLYSCSPAPCRISPRFAILLIPLLASSVCRVLHWQRHHNRCYALRRSLRRNDRPASSVRRSPQLQRGAPPPRAPRNRSRHPSSPRRWRKLHDGRRRCLACASSACKASRSRNSVQHHMAHRSPMGARPAGAGPRTSRNGEGAFSGVVGPHNCKPCKRHGTAFTAAATSE